MRARLVGRIGIAGLAAAAGLTVAGCADFARVVSLAPEPVDPNSPVAAEVREASRTKYPRPSFRDVPPTPTNVRPPAAFQGAVAASEQERARLGGWIAANPPMVVAGEQETEAFATEQRARVPAGQTGAPPDPAGSEDYAARLRALATPPPPPR